MSQIGALMEALKKQQFRGGPLTEAEATATYAAQPGPGVAGTDVQFGKVRTTGSGPAGSSLLSFQNNDPNAPDNATRIYFLPRPGYMPDGSSTSVGADNKLFATDYAADAVNYMDLGMYYHPAQVTGPYAGGDRGTRGYGVFWFNSKVNGTYAGKSPDIGWSMQDGQYVAGRVALATVNGVTPNIQFVFGTRQPKTGTKVAVVAEFQGDVGLNADADTAVRWTRSDAATTDNALSFQRHAAGGNVKVTLGSNQRMLLTNGGSLVLGNGASAMPTTSTEGFLYVNAMAGTPTGAPSAQGTAVPIALDTAGSKLWAYIGGAWKSVTLA